MRKMRKMQTNWNLYAFHLVNTKCESIGKLNMQQSYRLKRLKKTRMEKKPLRICIIYIAFPTNIHTSFRLLSPHSAVSPDTLTTEGCSVKDTER